MKGKLCGVAASKTPTSGKKEGDFVILDAF